MIRILQCVNNMHRAGLETVLMNYYRNIDSWSWKYQVVTGEQQEVSGKNADKNTAN